MITLKNMFFIIGIISFSNSVLAQDKKDEIYFTGLNKKNIKLIPDTGNIDKYLPFKDIVVSDIRPDTSFIGFERTGEKAPYKLEPEQRLPIAVKRYIAESFDLEKTESSPRLYLIIKKLILTEFIQVANYLNTDKMEWKSGILFKADLLSEENGIYKTLYQVDTIIYSEYELEGNESYYVTKAIDCSLENLLNRKLSTVKKGAKEFNGADINKYILTLNQYTITKDTQYKKGAYKTFDEFRKNNPSITNFEIKPYLNHYGLYLSENGKEKLSKDFWGYCDGTDIYIYTGNRYFRMIRSGNTFNFNGYKPISRPYNPGLLNAVSGLASLGSGNPTSPIMHSYSDRNLISKKGNIQTLQLDMDTGEAF